MQMRWVPVVPTSPEWWSVVVGGWWWVMVGQGTSERVPKKMVLKKELTPVLVVLNKKALPVTMVKRLRTECVLRYLN
jgi:hypothetical protein